MHVAVGVARKMIEHMTARPTWKSCCTAALFIGERFERG
jgi:hypothetical protein